MPPSIQEHVVLAPHTTLGAGGPADYFLDVSDREELFKAVAWATSTQMPVTILGSGSNVLVHDDGVRGLVVRPLFSDITYTETDDATYVRVEAGAILDELIAELVKKKLWGLENLSGIPGTVGAVPIQNVGAYGVEAKDVIESVTVYDLEAEAIRELGNTECQFAYRDSIFKKPEGKKYIILDVTFAVHASPHPVLSYRDLETAFKDRPLPDIEEIRNVVITIRSRKFPDWHTTGTAGSFFKNPIIPKDTYGDLRTRYPELPGFDMGSGQVKIPLGWVLDHVCGLKGYKEGNVGLFEAQALVLVCEKGTPAREIESFAQKIIDLVFERTGIHVEREVTSLA